MFAGMSSAVVFLVHPSSEPSPSKLSLLVPALVAGCHCLVAINGPSRVEGLTAGRDATGEQGDGTGTIAALVTVMITFKELATLGGHVPKSSRRMACGCH